MKKFRGISVCFVFSFLVSLTACDPVKQDIELERMNFSQSGQEFSIVSFYLYMPEYVKKAKENRGNIDRIYKRYVFDPIWKDFASKGECSFLANNIKSPVTDLDALNNEIDILSKSGVEEIVKEAVKKAARIFPGPNTTIYLQVLDPIYKRFLPKTLQTGVVAHTFGSGRIFVAIDPTVQEWQNYLLKIVAHEYHHSVWLSRNFETINFSLIEYLILEGRADSFADLVYPETKSPWTDLLDQDKEYDVWNQIENKLHTRDNRLNLRIVVGDKDIPFASGYTIGYRIMQEFLKNNPGVSLLEWTDMAAGDILLKSRYHDRFHNY